MDVEELARTWHIHLVVERGLSEHTITGASTSNREAVTEKS